MRSTTRPVAWQVGRHGEITGGMTQVVNSYLTWQFAHIDVQVVTSRDGTKGLRSVFLFLGALFRIATLRGTQRHLFVVHLSQGGSFVREGLLLLLAHARGFGTVAHIHGGGFADFAKQKRWLVKTILKSATRTIVLSDSAMSAVLNLLDNAKVELLQNAVPPGHPVTTKEHLIVFGGRVSRLKGIDTLISAWRQIGVGSGWHLAIAGPIVDPDLVPDNLPDATFLGPLSHEDLMAMLDRSSVAVLPSRNEAMPMFILEAMGRNNCVISTKVGGIPSVLDNGRGILIDAGDVEQLAAALERAIHDAQFRETTALTGRRAFDETFSADAIFPRIERLWLDVLHESTSPNKSKAART